MQHYHLYKLPKSWLNLILLCGSISISSVSCANSAGSVSLNSIDSLKWVDTPFGPQASVVDGNFTSGPHTTYIRFPAGMVTPVHTHSAAYTGIVISGTTMHWQPGKPESQIELPAGSHWTVPANSQHVSECLPGTDCIMAITQDKAFDFHAVKSMPLDDSAIVAIYNQVNGFDIAIGQLAMEKGSTNQVRLLGNMVANDHNAVHQSAAKTAIEQGIRPVLPVERNEAVFDHRATYDRLSELSGAEFDQAYLLYEIDFHENAIDAVENMLIPNLSNQAMKKLMSDILPGFKHHLAETTRVAKENGYL